MTRNLDSWSGDWANLKVAILGLGSTGFSAADTLHELGALVRVFAASAPPENADILDVLGIQLNIGNDAEQHAAVTEFQPELIIVSPGFKPNHPVLTWAGQVGVRVWTDIDLAWHLRDKTRIARWFTITGTNGKTTTAQMLTAMLNAGGLKSVACGNIGSPILDAIRDPEGFDALVVELSSFQLHYLEKIAPHTSAYLNLAADHLDWHGSFDEYAAAKAKVFDSTEFSAIYNVADSATERALEAAEVVEGARAIGFTVGIPGLSTVGYVDGILVDRAFLDDRQNSALEIASPEEIEKIGVVSPQLLQNLAAATAMARSAGVPAEAIRQAIVEFKTAPHRVQLVAEAEGITWIDDSKATNAHAARASLRTFDSIVWIVGGLLKGVDPEPLISEFKPKLRGAVIIGADTLELEQGFAKLAPEVPVRVISGGQGSALDLMARAVLAARQLAVTGDAVLLAPAAASMDQFIDYADRGEKFQAAVHELLRAPK